MNYTCAFLSLPSNIRTSSPPCGRSAEYCLKPATTQSITPPCRKNNEHTEEILLGTWPTTTPDFRHRYYNIYASGLPQHKRRVSRLKWQVAQRKLILFFNNSTTLSRKRTTREIALRSFGLELQFVLELRFDDEMWSSEKF